MGRGSDAGRPHLAARASGHDLSALATVVFEAHAAAQDIPHARRCALGTVIAAERAACTCAQAALDEELAEIAQLLAGQDRLAEINAERLHARIEGLLVILDQISAHAPYCAPTSGDTPQLCSCAVGATQQQLEIALGYVSELRRPAA